MCNDSKKNAWVKRLGAFGDQPTRAMEQVLPRQVVDSVLREQVGAYRERM